MALEKSGMSVAAYETKFHALSRYVMQLVTIEEDRIHLFVKVLNFKLHVFFIHRTSVGKNFNEVTNLRRKWRG